MTRTRTLAAPILAAVLALAAVPAGAQTLCSAPIAPICVDVETTYDDASTADRCRQDVEAYSESVEAYAACLQEQIDELRSHRDALDESFACRSEGGTDCPTVSTIPGS